MWVAARYFVALGLGLGLVVGMFTAMRHLIASEGAGLEDRVSRRIVGFVRTQRESPPPPPERRLPSRPETTTPPAVPPSSVGQVALGPAEAPSDGHPSADHALPELDLSLKGGLELGKNVHDTDATPMLRVQPEYPARAAKMNMEGWVLVRFGIGKLGQVVDPVVVDAAPANLFDDAALRAIRGWKYQPKVENGEPVVRHGLLVRLTFELD